MTTAQHCGYVALVGAPNAGKSTLLNRLLGTKLSIVSPKAQTTRFKVMGIALEGAAQLLFLDTPGIFETRTRLDRAMVEAAFASMADADIVALLVDVADKYALPQVDAIIEHLKTEKRPAILLLNKVDKVTPDALLPLADKLFKTGAFDKVFMISAANGDGCTDVMAYLAGAVPAGPWLYPDDQLTDIPSRLLAAEITREQLYLQLAKELPYAATVVSEAWEEFENGSIKISQSIIVQRDSQKAIVLGHKGARIKAIGQAARLELEKQFECRIHLFLNVKVRDNWQDDRSHYNTMGLNYEPDSKKKS